MSDDPPVLKRESTRSIARRILGLPPEDGVGTMIPAAAAGHFVWGIAEGRIQRGLQKGEPDGEMLAPRDGERPVPTDAFFDLQELLIRAAESDEARNEHFSPESVLILFRHRDPVTLRRASVYIRPSEISSTVHAPNEHTFVLKMKDGSIYVLDDYKKNIEKTLGHLHSFAARNGF